MALKLSEFNRGAEAIKAAAKGSGRAGGFAPQLKWDEGDEKYVLFLLPIDLSPVVHIHEWLDCGKKTVGDKEMTDWGFFLSRTDPVIGEESDPLTQKGSKPTKRTMSVAVEVDPIVEETGKGGGRRVRPKGFEVKTQTYDRKTDDGTEEVTTPVIGYVSQASGNFFNTLVAHDESGEFEGTVFKIKRVDDKTYTFTPYLDMDVDLSNLVEYVDGISYISRDEDTWNELEPELEAAEGPEDFALKVATALLERRLNELADWDEYQAKTGHIDRFVGKYDNKDSKGSKKDRPARQSQRSSSKSSEDGDGGETRSAASAARFADVLAAAKKREKAAK